MTASSPTTTNNNNNTETTTTFTYSRPVVPSLYFENHTAATTGTTTVSATPTAADVIPSELFASCVDFCDWGDLAKLACVQTSWSNIVRDTAGTSSQSKWELAQALMNGHCGLQPNQNKAVALLKELTGLPIDETTGNPIISSSSEQNDENDNSDVETTGYTPAIRQLAQCYLDGTGVDGKNPQCALAWLEASFLVGRDADAAHEVALIREYGRHGIEVDVVAAASWFEMAAEAGHVDSMTELGLCYELGCGVEQSDEKSLDWYTKAANLGHATAKFSVGEAFEEARGVPQSDQEAVLWYHRAALAGDDDSKKALRRLYDIARIVVPGVGDILRE
mmetsp:Transcript_2053/g.4737  ORF Transcript_2053/g.4737 Transcript_2053/m.4737 type:complete len:335 (-) Transcript_2053:175-1179(-)